VVTFAEYLRLYYRLEPGDVVPCSSPGYWRKLEPCGGLHGGCGNPVHHSFGSEGPIFHTIHYYDNDRDPDTGRYASPYRTWRAAAAQCGSTTVHEISSLLEIAGVAGRPVLDMEGSLRALEAALR
jgi:hypothetical protein